MEFPQFYCPTERSCPVLPRDVRYYLHGPQLIGEVGGIVETRDQLHHEFEAYEQHHPACSSTVN